VTAARRALWVALLLVTSWSLWAWAKPVTQVVHLEARSGETRAAEAHEDEAEGPAPMNWFEFGTPTPPFIAMVVNFGIVAAGYYLLGRKPIAAALQNRRDSIAKQIEEAQRMRREAEARAKTYRAKLDALEEEVRTVRETLVRAGEAERDRLIAEAQAKAERMVNDAQFLVVQEGKQIAEELWRDALEAVVGAAEDLLKKRVTQADQERLAEDYLADLGARPRAEHGAEPVRVAEPGGVPS
jgi:F0F1-type ATP synthase membrane subunit b/b'